MERDVFFVEKVNRWGETDDEVFEISVSEGSAIFNEELFKEGYQSRDVYEDFERFDYLSTTIIVNGKIISEKEFNNMGGYNAYDGWKWYEDEYFESYDEAIEFEKKLINDLLKVR